MGRKKWWVKHPMQTRFMAVVFAAMLTPVIVVGGGLYYLVFRMLAKQMAFPEAIASNLAPVVRQVNLGLLFSLPILLAAIGWVAIVMTHRFTGPLERFEKELDRVIQGHAHTKIRLRHHDALKEIADKINEILESKK